MAPDSIKSDVVIIGAGAAGLAAARDLSAAALRITIVEARNRIGGRIHTRYDPAVAMPIELGPEFIHGCPPETWSLVQRHGLTVVPVAEQHEEATPGGLEPADNEWSRIGDLLGRLDPSRPDETVTAFLAREAGGPDESKLRALVTRYVEGFHAARVDRIGVRALAAAESGEGSGSSEAYRLLDGYAAVPRLLHAATDPALTALHLGTRVRQVRWRRERVDVATTGRDGMTRHFTAPRAIITLPLGVLKASPGEPGAVEFDPPLSMKHGALARLDMGAVVRLVLRFREAWWPPELSFLHTFDDHRFGPWWTAAPVRAPLLTAWAGGPRAERLAPLDTAALAAAALDELSERWSRDRGELARLLAAAYHHDWIGDPLSRGGYSYPAVEGIEAPAELAVPVEGTLFLAGEAAAPRGQSGTVPGAIASGQRAARDLLDARG